MKRHRKTRIERKKQRKIIIASAFCMLFIMSAGYAAFQTNLNITAKGNISTKGISPNELKNQAVTSGDGLYKDITEEGRYVYRGANPNNYITFNDENWRIVAIENSGNLKIIRNEDIGSISYDPGYLTVIAGLTNANSVEGTRYSTTTTDYCYYSSGVESNYYGCNVWGSKTTMLNSSGINITKMVKEIENTTTYDLPEKEAYLNTYLNGTWYNGLGSETKALIDNHIWNVGQLKTQSGQTLTTDIAQESTYKWKGKVGLINVTDYVRSNTNTEVCGTFYANSREAGNASTCIKTTWLSGDVFWTMTPYAITSSYPTNGGIYDNGTGRFVYLSARAEYPVRPSVYLISDIHLKGTGTESDPYIIIT